MRLTEALSAGRAARGSFPAVPALSSRPLSCRCCNTCEDVREAYRRRGWAFKNPDTIEQCRREGFSQKMQEQKNEGCQVYGFLEVNKVQEGARPGGASRAVGWPHSTGNRGPPRPSGDKGKGGNTWIVTGNIPYRWLETSTLLPGRASSSPTCTVSGLHQQGVLRPGDTWVSLRPLHLPDVLCV